MLLFGCRKPLAADSPMIRFAGGGMFLRMRRPACTAFFSKFQGNTQKKTARPHMLPAKATEKSSLLWEFTVAQTRKSRHLNFAHFRGLARGSS
ncbi:hypothetical protein BaRGS_00028421 [Batillaria attramentaria]|uniref:Uncharacterized protein n=1 Tax=Batillaria attramentaria TaxID=370345 RepID=A0ABD0K073_9CAEN